MKRMFMARQKDEKTLGVLHHAFSVNNFKRVCWTNSLCHNEPRGVLK